MTKPTEEPVPPCRDGCERCARALRALGPVSYNNWRSWDPPDFVHTALAAKPPTLPDQPIADAEFGHDYLARAAAGHFGAAAVPDVPCYVVEHGHPYEPGQVVFAGTDRNAAFDAAHELEAGSVSVTQWTGGEVVDWWRCDGWWRGGRPESIRYIGKDRVYYTHTKPAPAPAGEGQ